MMSWRKLIRVVHRDIGYTAAALVIAYSISGLAVNHIEDWNPNYTFHESAVNIGAMPSDSYDAMEAYVVDRLDLNRAQVRGRVMDSETVFRVFLAEGQEVKIDVRTGQGTVKRVEKRAVLYQVNMLHLNDIKGAWPWIADLFAIALLVLAMTGMFIHKGNQGIIGRGKWFLAAGLAIPTLFIVYINCGAGIGAPH